MTIPRWPDPLRSGHARCSIPFKLGVLKTLSRRGARPCALPKRTQGAYRLYVAGGDLLREDLDRAVEAVVAGFNQDVAGSDSGDAFGDSVAGHRADIGGRGVG